MDTNNPANRGCPPTAICSTMRPAAAERYLSARQACKRKQQQQRQACILFGLVIILSCSIPSIISRAEAAAATSELLDSSSLSTASGSPFDFIKATGGSTNAADSMNLVSGNDRRSLPYAAAAAGAGATANSGQQHQFDPSSYKNIHEAIRNHPDLREFANLCELDEVKEIVSMDRTPLTVFAPIDKSLHDLLAKSKSRSINLIELAKHHIAQGLVTPDEYSKYPLQFNDYALLSPLYLNQQPASAKAGQRGQQSAAVFVNNAKILATYLIPIGSDNFQALHLIDQVMEFAYISRRTLLPAPSPGSTRKTATKKSKFSLDDLLGSPDQQQQVASEFHERFGDLQANQPQVDLYHPRAYSTRLQEQRLQIERDEFNLERLGRAIRQHPALRGKLFQVNESSSYNTYFLPMNTDELASLLEGPASKQLPALEALVIPDQVLFTRLMPLGVAHSTLFDRLNSATGQQRVSLSLAKTLPLDEDQQIASLESGTEESTHTSSRRLLSTPLLLQAKCQTISSSTQSQPQPQSSPAGSESSHCRPGVTSAELLVANIPLSNGVLHLIRRPVLLVDQPNVLDYLNDNENQLTNLVTALGSRTAAAASSREDSSSPTKVNRFRELLARERQLLSTFSTADGNKTLLVPSDKAFASLRYDLRALVQGDESLIPKEWSQSYRQDLLERLVKSHVVPHESITTDQLEASAGEQPLQALTDNGRSLVFVRKSSARAEGESEYFVECEHTRAQLIQHDLIGSNGVVHIIDRVLGEDQETVHSLLKSIVLKYNQSLESDSPPASGELSQLVQSSIRNNKQQQISSTEQPAGPNDNRATELEPLPNPELQAISKSIGQYLEEIAASNKRQMQMLASSVNISYQLARLTSLAEGLDDWNDKFRQSEKLFTYFVPSDLAWIRLQQQQPELYKPLMYFLEHQQQSTEDSSSSASGGEQQNNSLESASKPTPARSSESSHRLRQILERHLVVDRKIDARNLNQLDSVKTMGATLRLVESPAQSQLTATYSAGDGSNLSSQQLQQPSSNFAALHSIFTGTSGSSSSSSGQHQQLMQQPKLKSLKLNAASANIVQANEASNGFVYVIDNVLLLPEDSNYIVLTSQSPAISSSMSSLLGAHNSAIFDFVHSFLAPAPFNMSTNSTLALMATLTVAIVILLILALVLVVRKSRQSKQNRHQQLESGLTSSSSANSGSTSTTKSL